MHQYLSESSLQLKMLFRFMHYIVNFDEAHLHCKVDYLPAQPQLLPLPLLHPHLVSVYRNLEGLLASLHNGILLHTPVQLYQPRHEQ